MFKGLIMDRCVLLTSTPACLFHCPGQSQGRSPSDRPTSRKQIRKLMSTTHSYPWLIPIITWCQQFCSLSTDILLIKSKLKLGLRATAVSVAMSPRNLGGKYCYCPHPRSRKCTGYFFAGSRACQWNCTRVASWLGDNVLYYVVCLQTEFLWHTILFQLKWQVLHIWFIYPSLNRSVCLLMGPPTW